MSVLLGLGLILIRSFFLMPLFISFGMGMFTLCYCILELCNLIFFVCLFFVELSIKRLPWDLLRLGPWLLNSFEIVKGNQNLWG